MAEVLVCRGKPREWSHRKERSCVPMAGDAKCEVPTGSSDAVVTWGCREGWEVWREAQIHRTQMELNSLGEKARLKFFPYLVLEGHCFGLYSSVNSAKILK